MTGPGPPVTVPGQPDGHPLVLDGRGYWQHLGDLGRRARNICVIGSGETAAWVVITLARHCHEHSAIDVLTSRGVLTRAARATTRTVSTPIRATGPG